MKKRMLAFFTAIAVMAASTGNVLAEDVILSDEPAEEHILETGTVESEKDTDPEEEEIIEEEILISEESENGQTDSLNLEGETLLLSVEEAADYEDEAEIELGTEIIQMDTSDLFQIGEAGDAADATMPLFSLFSAAEYTDSYGAQLEGNAKDIYDSMKAAYVDGKGSGTIAHSLATPYEFELIDGKYDDAEGKVVWDETGEAYLEARMEIAYVMQCAYEAFVYDYPEVFWFHTPKYGLGYSLYKVGDVYTKAKYKTIYITPVERYENASSEISAFESAVDAAAAEITASLPENPTRAQILEEIHDYLGFQVTYAEGAYARTAAGVFLKDKQVVCEGYAKACKVLCKEFGIESVLIPGGALKSDGSTEGHMWNYVKMEDGKWYMIDTTWDDQRSYIKKTYFLAGSSSMGFNAVISTERSPYQKFSGENVNSQTFVFPELSETAYTGTWHEWNTEKTEDVAATCTEEGQKSIHCRTCGESKDGTEEAIAVLSHRWGSITVTTEPTCIQEGVRTYSCGDCSYTETEAISMTDHIWDDGEEISVSTCTTAGIVKYTCETCPAEREEELPLAEHSWNTTRTEDQAATCTAAGQTSIHCSVCGTIQAGSEQTIAKLAHSYGTSYKITRVATVLKKGIRTYTCKYCSEPRHVLTAMVKPTITLSASSLRLQMGQETKVLKVTGLARGDSVASWKSSNTSIVKVDKYGIVTAQKKTGKAYIIITLASNKTQAPQQYKVLVTVQKKKVKTTAISVTKKSLIIQKGKKYPLNPEITITPVTSQEGVTYTSSNKKVATVSKKGVITAKGPGTAKITIRSGSKYVKVKVTVPKVKTKSLTAVSSISVKAGKKRTLKVTVNPLNSDQKVTFTSGNKKIAVVNQNGRITGKKAGKTKIIVKSGSITHTCIVTVTK